MDRDVYQQFNIVPNIITSTSNQSTLQHARIGSLPVRYPRPDFDRPLPVNSGRNVGSTLTSRGTVHTMPVIGVVRPAGCSSDAWYRWPRPPQEVAMGAAPAVFGGVRHQSSMFNLYRPAVAQATPSMFRQVVETFQSSSSENRSAVMTTVHSASRASIERMWRPTSARLSLSLPAAAVPGTNVIDGRFAPPARVAAGCRLKIIRIPSAVNAPTNLQPLISGVVGADAHQAIEPITIQPLDDADPGRPSVYIDVAVDDAIWDHQSMKQEPAESGSDDCEITALYRPKRKGCKPRHSTAIRTEKSDGKKEVLNAKKVCTQPNVPAAETQQQQNNACIYVPSAVVDAPVWIERRRIDELMCVDAYSSSTACSAVPCSTDGDLDAVSEEGCREMQETEAAAAGIDADLDVAADTESDNTFVVVRADSEDEHSSSVDEVVMINDEDSTTALDANAAAASTSAAACDSDVEPDEPTPVVAESSSRTLENCNRLQEETANQEELAAAAARSPSPAPNAVTSLCLECYDESGTRKTTTTTTKPVTTRQSRSSARADATDESTTALMTNCSDNKPRPISRSKSRDVPESHVDAAFANPSVAETKSRTCKTAASQPVKPQLRSKVRKRRKSKRLRRKTASVRSNASKSSSSSSSPERRSVAVSDGNSDVVDVDGDVPQRPVCSEKETQRSSSVDGTERDGCCTPAHAVGVSAALAGMTLTDNVNKNSSVDMQLLFFRPNEDSSSLHRILAWRKSDEVVIGGGSEVRGRNQDSCGNESRASSSSNGRRRELLYFQCTFCPYQEPSSRRIAAHMRLRHDDLIALLNNRLKELFPDGVVLSLFCRHCDFVTYDRVLMWIHYHEFHMLLDILTDRKFCPDARAVELSKLNDSSEVCSFPFYRCCSCDHVTDSRRSAIDHVALEHSCRFSKCFVPLTIVSRPATFANETYRAVSTEPEFASFRWTAYACVRCEVVWSSAHRALTHSFHRHRKSFMVFVCDVIDPSCGQRFVTSTVARHLQQHYRNDATTLSSFLRVKMSATLAYVDEDAPRRPIEHQFSPGCLTEDDVPADDLVVRPALSDAAPEAVIEIDDDDDEDVVLVGTNNNSSGLPPDGVMSSANEALQVERSRLFDDTAASGPSRDADCEKSSSSLVSRDVEEQQCDDEGDGCLWDAVDDSPAETNDGNTNASGSNLEGAEHSEHTLPSGIQIAAGPESVPTNVVEREVEELEEEIEQSCSIFSLLQQETCDANAVDDDDVINDASLMLTSDLFDGFLPETSDGPSCSAPAPDDRCDVTVHHAVGVTGGSDVLAVDCTEVVVDNSAASSVATECIELSTPAGGGATSQTGRARVRYLARYRFNPCSQSPTSGNK